MYDSCDNKIKNKCLKRIIFKNFTIIGRHQVNLASAALLHLQIEKRLVSDARSIRELK